MTLQLKKTTPLVDVNFLGIFAASLLVVNKVMFFLIHFGLKLVIFRTEFLIFGSLWLRFPEVQQKLPPVQRPKQKPGRPTVIPEREVLFSGQAFDADYISNPSKKFVQPVTRPDVFDLTVSVKQNFGGNNPKPKGNFLIVIM